MTAPARSTPWLIAAGLALGGVMLSGAATAQPFAGHYPQATGEALYTGVCQACHMPDARGAIGAGAYPALAHNRHLQSANYPVLVLINGQKAMPSFGDALSDDQIAAVVNYVRSNFGNTYKDKITAAEVKALRPPPPAP
jgi:mono/diheme cytochrome c family protein